MHDLHDLDRIANALAAAAPITLKIAAPRVFNLVSLLHLALTHPEIPLETPFAQDMLALTEQLTAELNHIDPAIAAVLNEAWIPGAAAPAPADQN